MIKSVATSSPITVNLRLTADGCTVNVYPMRRCRNITLRRSGAAEFRCSVPYGLPYSELADVLPGLIERLKARSPEAESAIGHDWSFTGEDFEIAVTHNSKLNPQRLSAKLVTTSPKLSFAITVNPEADFSDPAFIDAFSRLARRVAVVVTERNILPMAAETASRLGLKPKMFKVSSATRRLGSCTSGGVINISAICAFLPHDLRHLIICHELAHLTEMNHSPRFHALVDSYTGGRERRLERQLKAFRWPVQR